MTHHRRVFLLCLLGGLPAVALSVTGVWAGDFTPKVVWTVTVLVPLLWLSFAAAVRSEVVRPLQSLANLIKALREGDFSVRGRAAGGDEALGAAVAEVNALGNTLLSQSRWHPWPTTAESRSPSPSTLSRAMHSTVATGARMSPENRMRAGRKPGTFPKGRSGNPGGRKPVPPDVKAALEAACPKAVERLVELVDSPNERVALAASQVVIDRVLGRPAQAVNEEDELAKLSTDELTAQVVAMMAATDKGRADLRAALALEMGRSATLVDGHLPE